MNEHDHRTHHGRCYNKASMLQGKVSPFQDECSKLTHIEYAESVLEHEMALESLAFLTSPQVVYVLTPINVTRGCESPQARELI
jgi:hypothetical protein